MSNQIQNLDEYSQWRANNYEKTCLVKFGSEACPPCQKLKPLIEAIADKQKGTIAVASIDSTKSPDLRKHFMVKKIPLCVVFPKSKKIMEMKKKVEADVTSEDKNKEKSEENETFLQSRIVKKELLNPDGVRLIGYKPDDLIETLKKCSI